MQLQQQTPESDSDRSWPSGSVRCRRRIPSDSSLGSASSLSVAGQEAPPSVTSTQIGENVIALLEED